MMRSTLLACGALGLFAPVYLRASTGPIPLRCDRVCLENVVDQYLAALAARDPKRLPLSADVRYSENDQPMSVGDGFWKTVEGRGNYKHIFADPEAGQVVFMGTMHEAGTAHPAWTYHRDREHLLPAGRRRSREYRRPGQTRL